SVLEELGYSADADVHALTDSTIYPPMRGELVRRGRFSGEVESVKGQIISNGRLCMAITSGKAMREPSQTGLGDY
ncbi:MAG: hypothetical protein SXQ77_00280, partial [Halobacteria archaeon]|nr:hypothetical protein [Halobacteria archaeon]